MMDQKTLKEIAKEHANGKKPNIQRFKYVELYELLDWDGADGRTNRSNGFVTKSKQIAEEWTRNGNSYRKICGVLIDSLSDIKSARDELDKQKALAKLSVREKQLLGLE